MARRSRNGSAFIDTRILVNNIIEQVGDQIDAQLTDALKDWASRSEMKIKERKGLRAINQTAAEGARTAVYQAYVNSGLGVDPSYRFNDRGKKWRRYSNGRMEEGLLDNRTIFADRESINFVDKTNMDKFAKQWYRLNFGTKPGRDKAIKPMEIFDVPLKKSPTLVNYRLSPKFSMPEGILSSTFSPKTIGTHFAPPSSGANAFYAIGRRNPRPKVGNGRVTRGRKSRSTNQIVGRSFLDAGVEDINIRYPKLLEPVLRSWVSYKR